MKNKAKKYYIILISLCFVIILGIIFWRNIDRREKCSQNVLFDTESTALELPAWEQLSFFKVDKGGILFSICDYEKEMETLYSLEGELSQISMLEEDFLDAVIMPDQVYYVLMITIVDGKEHLVVKGFQSTTERMVCYLDDYFVEGRDDCYQWKMTAGKSDRLIVYSPYGYMEISINGEILNLKIWQNAENYDVVVSDDGVWYSYFEGGERKLQYQDRLTGNSKQIALPHKGTSLWKMYLGEAGDFYLLEEEGIFQYDFTDNNLHKVLGWSDYGYVSKDVVGIFSDRGNISCLIYQNNCWEIISWMPDRFVEKEKIIMGGVGITDEIRTYAACFNQKQAEYMIEVVDYGQAYAYEDRSKGIQDLYRAILAGKGPDIIAINLEYMDYTTFMENSILEDLTPYMERSEVLKKEDIVPSIQNFMKYKDEIGMIPTNFAVRSWMINRKYLEKETISVDEILEILQEKPEEIDSSYGRENLLEILYGNCDGEELKEKINNGEFEKSLEIIRNYPESGIYESNWELYGAGEIAFLEYVLSGVEDYMYGKSIWGEQGVFLEESDALPIEIYLRNCWGINSRSKYKDVAWTFIESFFTKEWMEKVTPNWGFSTNTTYFSKQLDQALKNHLRVDSTIYMQTGSIMEITEEDIQRLYNMVYNVKARSDGNSQVLKIIEEEAGSYFIGDKTAEEVSAVIQNRVELYIEEQE